MKMYKIKDNIALVISSLGVVVLGFVLKKAWSISEAKESLICLCIMCFIGEVVCLGYLKLK